MLNRPKLEEKRLGILKREAFEASQDVVSRTVDKAENEGELTEGMVFNEYVALNVLANLAVNIVMQDKGTLEEYLDFVKATIAESYWTMQKDPNLKPHLAGGKEITMADMQKALGHEVQ
jgi:hypothetical protein